MSDYSLTTFGESGELTQVRHALTAVGRGETIVGIRARNGIVIAAEKKRNFPQFYWTRHLSTRSRTYLTTWVLATVE